MNKYFLDEEDIGTLISVIPSFSSSQTKAENFKKYVAGHILPKQRDLEGAYFKSKKVSNNSELQSLFKGLIEFESVKQIFFNNDGYYSKKEKLLKEQFHKKLIKVYPGFLSDLTSAVEKSSGNNEFLFNAYFQALKSKEVNKSQYTNEEILENIKKFKTGSNLSLAKKKINSYISLFGKTHQLYDFVMKDMEEVFKVSAEISNYWEEKLNNFAQNCKENYFERNNSIKMFEVKQQYMYILKLNCNWIISTEKISNKKATTFIESFNSEFYNLAHNRLGVNRESSSQEQIKFLTDTQTQLEALKDFSDKVMKIIPSLIKNYDFNAIIKDESEKIRLQIERYLFSQSLDEKLEDKNNSNKSMKI